MDWIEWVLAPHASGKTPRPVVSLEGTADAATVEQGLYWGVVNGEGTEFKPESMWETREAAERRADDINGDADYPSWFATPVFVGMWMRNEFLPDSEKP